MNCANHIDRLATGYCQNCGKPLCPECSRSADGLLLCEPCLVARQGAQASAAGSAWGGASASPGAAGAGTVGGGAAGGTSGTSWQRTGRAADQGWAPVPGAGFRPGAPPFGTPVYPPTRSTGQPSPGIAGLLGFIPGVGAMYNGQFVKALLHVVGFILLIGASEHFPLAGILIAAWVFYQVFDAVQTAAARRDGLPLPDPFGILDLSLRLGPQTPPTGYGQGYVPTAYPPQPNQKAATAAAAANAPYAASTAAAWASPNQAAAQSAGGSGSGAVPPPYTPPYAAPYAQPQAAYSAPYPVMPPTSTPRGEPIGAIVLIVVGLLFLLSTLGWLSFDWIARGWPVLLLLAGGWLLIRRARSAPVAPVPPAYNGLQPFAAGPSESSYSPAPFTAIERNPLSITPAAPFPGQTESEEDRR